MLRKINDNQLILMNHQGRPLVTLTETMNADKSRCIIELEGMVNDEAASDVADELFALLSVKTALQLNLKNISYLSNKFHAALIELERKSQERLHCTMPIKNVSVGLYNEFMKAGYAYSLDIHMEVAGK